jgi:hypothetical protein
MAKKVANVDIPDSVSALDPNYDGLVVISDIDKTYLATQIDSLSGLLRAAFETPERKANIPGFSVLLRALRRGGEEKAKKNPIYFISASPPQIEGRILQKMDLDGVEHDGIIFKNQLEHVRSGNFQKLKEQIGYKLTALIALWSCLPQKSKLILFGDDSESDAVIFSLFSEILAHNIARKELYELLRFLGVYHEESIRVLWLARKIRQPVCPILMAFINLETGSRSGYYSRYGHLIYPSENSLQTAFALFERGMIRDRAVKSVVRQLVFRYDFSPEELSECVEQGYQLGLYQRQTFEKVAESLVESGLLAPFKTLLPGEGDFSSLNFGAQAFVPVKASLRELKKRYSEEGRY